MALQICLQPVSKNKFNVSFEIESGDKSLVIEGYSNLSFGDAIEKIKQLRVKKKQKIALN